MAYWMLLMDPRLFAGPNGPLLLAHLSGTPASLFGEYAVCRFDPDSMLMELDPNSPRLNDKLKNLGYDITPEAIEESKTEAIQDCTNEAQDAHAKVIEIFTAVHNEFVKSRTDDTLMNLFLDAAAVKYAVFGEVEWTSETVKRWQHKLSARPGQMYGWLSNILGEWKPERAEKFCRFATSSKQVPTNFKFEVGYHFTLNRIPAAYTCFSTVHVPDYPSQAALKAGLQKALDNSNDDYQFS